MKKYILLLILLLQFGIAQAATQLKVTALQEFTTEKPEEAIVVALNEDSQLGNYDFKANTVLTCRVFNIVEPKRGKRDAYFYVIPVYYSTDDKLKRIEQEMYGKYTKRVLSKEELKKIPSFKTFKKAALAIGNHFVKGLSASYAFVEGVVKNEKDGRIKSGVVNAYEESPLSIINQGEQLRIAPGDEFYFVFKTNNDD